MIDRLLDIAMGISIIVIAICISIILVRTLL